MRDTIALLLAAAALAGAACGGAESAPEASPSPAAAAPQEEAPTGSMVAMDGEIAPAPLPDSVAVFEADLLVSGVTTTHLGVVNAIEGVQYAAPLALLAAQARDTEIDVAVVDPTSFRPLTPAETADAAAVWERVQDGDAVFTHAAGNELEALLGSTIALVGERSSQVVRVGAYATNGVPPIADVIVNWDAGTAIGATTPDHLLVAVSDDASPSEVSSQIEELTGGEVTIREKPSTQTVAAAGSLEPFTYVSVGDGTIQIDPAWVNRNIVTVDLPIFGRTRCHRIIIPQLSAALNELVALGLGELITDYSGCYVPRHMLWNPNRGISRHAWGLAFDVNVGSNGYGETPTLDPRVVSVFKKWGFEWGGDWSTPDGMHFELDRIVTPS